MDTGIFQVIILGIICLTFITTLIILVYFIRIGNVITMLYQWHDINDADGVKLWYFPRSLEDTIAILACNVDKQREAIEAQTRLLTYLRGRGDILKES